MTEPLQPSNGAPQPVVKKTQTSSLKLPGLDRPATGALGRPASGPLPAAAPAQAEGDPVEASRTRMAFINGYLKAPSSDPAYQDKTMVHRVMAEERAYQQALVVEIMAEQKRVPAGDPRAAELESLLKMANSRQGNLLTLMKRVAAEKGTGTLGPLDA
jgi:hypothetical protein